MRIALLLLAVGILRADELEQNLKDSAKVHRLLGNFRKTQAEIDKTLKQFADRNHCASGNATLDGAGFLACTPAPPPAPRPEPAKPEEKK